MGPRTWGTGIITSSSRSISCVSGQKNLKIVFVKYENLLKGSYSLNIRNTKPILPNSKPSILRCECESDEEEVGTCKNSQRKVELKPNNNRYYFKVESFTEVESFSNVSGYLIPILRTSGGRLMIWARYCCK